MNPDLEKLPALRNLTHDVKQKAMEFADALGARGPRPTTVLGTAVTLAQEWKSGRLPMKQGGPAVLVQPRNGRWIIRRADSEHATHMFMVREDAVRRAQDLARRFGTACLVFGPGGTLIERYEAPGAAPTPVAPEPPVVAPAPAVSAEPIVTAPVAPPLDVVAPRTEVVLPEPPVELATATTESVVIVAPEPEPEPLLAAVAAAECEPEPPSPPALDPEAGPIRVRKLGQKWAVILGDGRTEAFPTRQKAQKRAKDLGQALGRAVIVL